MTSHQRRTGGGRSVWDELKDKDEGNDFRNNICHNDSQEWNSNSNMPIYEVRNNLGKDTIITRNILHDCRKEDNSRKVIISAGNKAHICRKEDNNLLEACSSFHSHVSNTYKQPKPVSNINGSPLEIGCN